MIYSHKDFTGTSYTPSGDYMDADATLADHKHSSSKASLGGNHNTVWQSEACYSVNNSENLRRCPSRFPVYHQMPGEFDCPHYMRTRTCMLGGSCKFDHPLWVPEGGIPDSKEVSVTAIEPLPERPGKQVCPLFLVLNKCKYGQTCRFHHPKEKVASLSDLEHTEGSELRKRPLKPLCKFNMAARTCNFGSTCLFNHPKHISRATAGVDNGNGGQIGALTGGINEESTLSTPSSTPAISLNSAGLPIRLGVKNCNLYLKNGSCSFGSVCYFNHPERDAMDPPGAIVAAPASHINHGLVNPALISQTMHGSDSRIYRQRPGKEKCKHYMKKGKCTFKKCKYDHPPRTSDAL